MYTSVLMKKLLVEQMSLVALPEGSTIHIGRVDAQQGECEGDKTGRKQK